MAPQAAPRDAPGGLVRASECAVKGTRVNNLDWAEEMVLRGDNGWCWHDVWRYVGTTKTAPWIRLTTRPSNGEVQIIRLSDMTRIAYRPRPGQSGKDQFGVVDETFNGTVTFNVTVKP